MPYLLDIKHASKNMRRLTLNVHLQENVSSFKKDADMRLVFTTTLSVDVAPHDEELRKAFIQLVTENARQVHPIAAMLSKGKPEFKLSLTDREGKQNLPLHGDEESPDLIRGQES